MKRKDHPGVWVEPSPRADRALGAAGRRERPYPGQRLPFSGTCPCGSVPRPL